jgi:hypothetical protein
MSVRRLAAAAVIAVIGALVLGGGSASAATYLRTDPGDALLSGSTVLSNTTSDRAVLATSTGTFTCQGTSLAASATGNANAFGSLTATLTSLTFTSCADDGAPVNFSSCALHAGSAPPTVQLDGDFTAGTVRVSGIVERCAVQSSSSACYYTQLGTATGTFTNATSSLTLSSIALTRATTTTDGLSASWCGEAGTLSTTVTDVVQQSTGNTLTVTAPPPPPTPTALRTDPGNVLLTGATTLRNTTSSPAVLTSSLGVVTCAQTFLDADVSSNANATTSITGKVTSLTFTSCTDTFAPVTYTSCSLHVGSPLPTVRLTGSSAGGGTMSVANAVVRCSVLGTVSACYFAISGSANASFVNATSSINFTNLSVVTVVPTSDALPALPCLPVSSLSFALTHIVQGATNRTVTLTTS